MSNRYDRLLELRTEKGVSQKEAAKDLEVSQALLSHYEKGVREFGLDFLCRASDYYGVTADYILNRTESRAGLDSSSIEETKEDKKFNAATVYKAAIMTHERMNSGSLPAGECADLLYAITIYEILYTAAQHGYIPKRWFSLPAKSARLFAGMIYEDALADFPEKTNTARRYGGPEPLSIETVIRQVENDIKKFAGTVVDKN